MSDNRPGTLLSAIGLAVLINSLAIILVALIGNDWLMLKAITILPFVFILVTATPYARVGILDFFQREDSNLIEREKNRIELERLRKQYEVIKLGEQIKSDAVIDGDSEKQRLSLWRKYWIKVAERCRDHNSVISWRDASGNGLDKLMKYQVWYESIALPFIRQGWMTPVFQGGKSKLADNMTMTRILDELSANHLPTAPFGEPPALQTLEQFEQSDSQANAYQNTKQEFETA